jgi:hypothetical protein
MPLPSTLPRFVRGAACALALAFAASPVHAQRGGGPFAGLTGTWSGSGVIALASGANERIRCRAAYDATDASHLLLNLRCASDSYNFDLRADVHSQGGALTGIWSEASRGVTGNVSGSASPGHVQAQVTGPSFSASLSMSTRGNQQSVTIRSQGTDVQQVSITLKR